MTVSAGTIALKTTPTVLILIPFYNNRDTIYGVAAAAAGTGLPVLVVDDGSRDGGCNTLENLEINLLTLEYNQGKGAAILAGARWAASEHFTHVITIDADNQHDPLEAKLFVEQIESQPSTIIIGNRNFDVGLVPGSSKFGRRFSNFWVRVSTGSSVADSQSGFRSYPVEILQHLKCRGTRYEYEVEILVRSIWAGVDVISVPISTSYTVETQTASNFRPLRDNLRIAWIYTQLVLRNFLPWPHSNLHREPVSGRIREYLANPWTAIKSLLTERTSPGEIVAASMLGIFLGTLPLIAVHSIVIIFMATRLRLNRLLALNISHLCAPPFVPALALEAGFFLRHGYFLVDFNFQTLGRQFLQRLGDYLLGSIVLAPLLALLIGVLVAVIVFPVHYWQLRRTRNRRDG